MLRPNTIALTALLGLLTAFGPVATDMYVPSMPDIGRLLAARTSEVQLTLSSYLVGFAIGQIIYGPISDRYGRKPVLLMALVLFCAASLACAAAPTIETLIAARILQAFGGSGAIVLPRAIVRDLYAGDRAGRELSRMGAIMSFAPVIAPLIGGIVQVGFGWRANFIIIVVVGLLATVMVWRSMPETLNGRSADAISIVKILQGYRTFAKNRAFLAHLGIVACSYAGLFAWISGSPFVLQNLYGLSAFEFSIAFATACIGSLVGAAIAASLVMRVGLDRTIGAGAVALAVGGLAMVASLALGLAPVTSLVLSMMLYHAGLMLAMPQAIAGAMTPFPDCAGTTSSLVGLVQQTSAALLGAIVGLTLGQSAWPLAGAIAMMGCSLGSFARCAGRSTIFRIEDRPNRLAARTMCHACCEKTPPRDSHEIERMVFESKISGVKALAWHDQWKRSLLRLQNTTPQRGPQHGTRCEMNDDLVDRIVSFLDVHHVMTLATIGQDGPHAASLLYVRDRFTLIWVSDPASRHSVHIDAFPDVAATIAPDYCDFPEIQGLQISGQAERIHAELERVRARKCLQTRYPFLQNASAGLRELRDAYDHAQIYRLNPARMVLIDNRRGFGSKEVLDLTSASGPPSE